MKSKNIIVYQRKRLAKKAICKGPAFTLTQNNRRICQGRALTLKALALNGLTLALGLRRKLGLMFLGLGLVGFLFFLSPYIAVWQAKKRAQGFAPLIAKKMEPVRPIAYETQITATETENPPEPTKEEKPKEIKSFYLTIEKIGLISAPIVAQVDVNDKNQYQKALSQGLVHAQSTSLPDEGRMVYIFGHSTNYAWFVKEINALFYQIEKLETGDRVKIEFNGQSFVYYVYDKKIVDYNDTNPIEQVANEDVLVLQSCWPPGTTLKRVLIFCRPSKFGGLIY
ncbi:MAG TPA: sortase [Candidatus Bathyarchaeia archaeon]|nr:sortase [Candidatus Bathyarchaeia archaeon]